MSVALHGSLRDFGIGEVFQLIGQQRKTGVLEIEDTGERICITFENGSVVTAERAGPYEGANLGDMLVRVGLLTPDRLVEIENELEGGPDFEVLVRRHTQLTPPEIEEIVDLVTRDTIFSLLRWTQGSFHFTSQPVASGHDPSRLLPAEQILMDGMRMVDEWRALDDSVTNDSGVFQRVGRFESYRGCHVDESPERLAAAERLFLLIDGRLPVRRVTDLSRLGNFEGARVLSQLLAIGIIEAVDQEALDRRRSRRVAVDGAPAYSPPGIIVAALPFLLLVAVAVLAARGPAGAPDVQGVARDPASEARMAFETRRLRNWVEAYYFARGRWPADLASLSDLGGDAALSPGPLATVQERPYYYARRGENFSLLAPEH